uniref:F-box associated beta-propeller type 3 domain-containing protein n=1 Tax=Oryza meridionalis TaxID=40149 RepID=A0A0E0CM44_9ORYZ
MMQQDSKRKRSVLPETATLAPGSKRRRRKSVPSCHAAAMLPDELLTEVTPAPCHGLALLYDGIAPAYYVMNATTRAVTRLPPFQDVAFATAGLGCDARTKKYKVMRLFEGNLLEKEFLKCEIYTLGGDEGDHWRPAAGGVPFRFYSFARSAISNAVMNKLQPLFFNGYLHWLINPLHHVKLPRASILSFSLTDETFRWIRSPPFVASGVHLVELDGNLCMVRDLRDRSTAVCKLEIWKLKDYNSGNWSLDHRIDLTGQLPRDLLEPQIVKVIGSAGSCRSGTKIIIATSKHKVCSYDPVSRTLETITSISETCTSYQNEKSDIRFSLFKECLTPVHKTREEIAFATPLSKATKEILLRLPAESVLKFKPVCKQWLGLIKSERFIRAYFAHKNMDKRPKIMLVGKGSGKSLFNFVPLNKWLQEASNQGTLFLDTKVVCSKPCRGLNLMSFMEEDYLFNPCTGYHRVYWNREWHQHQPWKMPTGYREQEDNPFAVGNKNVGLGFSQVIQDHVVVGIFYDRKDYNSREYSLTCSLWSCGSGYFEQLPQPPLPVNDMPPVSVDGVLYWMSEPRLGQSYERAIVSFDIAAKIFEVIPCPSSIAMWDPPQKSLPCICGGASRKVVSLATPKVQQQRTGGHLKCHITRCEDVPRKFSPWKLSMAPCENFATPPSASSGKNLLSSRHQYVKALNSVSPKNYNCVA